MECTNKHLLAWVASVQKVCQPKDVYWCDGSEEENQRLFSEMVNSGVAIKLSRPNSYLFRTDAGDTARREQVTFICTEKEEDAGPTNKWRHPTDMLTTMKETFTGCMAGRTMYVIPFSMGPVGSPLAKYGVQISDSPYVVVNMRIMARIGKPVLDILNQDTTVPNVTDEASAPFYYNNNNSSFVPCLHSVGYPLITAEGPRPDVKWPTDLKRTYIAHFIDNPSMSIVSFGSGYGGNALLGKKCLALRIASALGKKEGWLAEHMLIAGVTDENGNKTYISAAFPSACGKTNLAMLKVPDALAAKGWKVSTVGDDIAWIRPVNGKLHAINPENGFFGVAPGTSYKTNASAMESVKSDTIFTNVAYNPETNDVWWEGMTDEPPARLIDWLGNEWTPGCGRVSSHPNSRFTAPIKNCPVLDEKWDDLNGVPLSAILYGGRRATDIPLVSLANTYAQGIYMGATISSENFSGAAIDQERIRADPFAQLPFMSYNMAAYIKHQLRVFKGLTTKPLIASVNWFRRDENNERFLWPGFGENMRVIQWIVKRVQGRAAGRETPLGVMPSYEDFEWEGLDFTKEQFDTLLSIDNRGLKERTLMTHEQLFVKLGDEVPMEMHLERRALLARL